MDRRCVGQVERNLRPFAIDYSYIERAAINSTFIGRLKSYKNGNGDGRLALAFPVNYIVHGYLCAVAHPRFLIAVPSTHDASSLGQIKNGLEIV